MKNVRVQDLARNPAVRIGAVAGTLIAGISVAALLIVPRLEGDSDRQSGSEPNLLSSPNDGAATSASSPAESVNSALPPAYLHQLLDLLNSLPQPEGLTMDVPPSSAAADVYDFYRANAAPEQLLDFYRRELVALGWQPETHLLRWFLGQS